MLSPQEESLISDFLAGVPHNHIDGIILRTVRFKGWRVNFDADDVIQNTRLALLKSFQEGKYRGEGLTTYVRKVGEVQCLLAIRKSYRTSRHEEEWTESALEHPESSPEPLSTLIDQEKRKLAPKVLKALDKLCRQLIFLRLYKELNYIEIGRRLGLSETNARVSFHRCLKRSKEVYEKILGGL